MCSNIRVVKGYTWCSAVFLFIFFATVFIYTPELMWTIRKRRKNIIFFVVEKTKKKGHFTDMRARTRSVRVPPIRVLVFRLGILRGKRILSLRWDGGARARACICSEYMRTSPSDERPNAFRRRVLFTCRFARASVN